MATATRDAHRGRQNSFSIVLSNSAVLILYHGVRCTFVSNDTLNLINVHDRPFFLRIVHCIVDSSFFLISGKRHSTLWVSCVHFRWLLPPHYVQIYRAWFRNVLACREVARQQIHIATIHSCIGEAFFFSVCAKHGPREWYRDNKHGHKKCSRALAHCKCTFPFDNGT